MGWSGGGCGGCFGRWGEAADVCVRRGSGRHEALSDADGDTFAPELRNCVV